MSSNRSLLTNILQDFLVRVNSNPEEAIGIDKREGLRFEKARLAAEHANRANFDLSGGVQQYLQ